MDLLLKDDEEEEEAPPPPPSLKKELLPFITVPISSNVNYLRKSNTTNGCVHDGVVWRILNHQYISYNDLKNSNNHDPIYEQGVYIKDICPLYTKRKHCVVVTDHGFGNLVRAPSNGKSLYVDERIQMEGVKRIFPIEYYDEETTKIKVTARTPLETIQTIPDHDLYTVCALFEEKLALYNLVRADSDEIAIHKVESLVKSVFMLNDKLVSFTQQGSVKLWDTRSSNNRMFELTNLHTKDIYNCLKINGYQMFLAGVDGIFEYDIRNNSGAEVSMFRSYPTKSILLNRTTIVSCSLNGKRIYYHLPTELDKEKDDIYTIVESCFYVGWSNHTAVILG